jgi:hypothetical protein
LPALQELSIEGIGGTALNGHRQEGLYFVLRRWAGLQRLHGLELTRLDPGEDFQGALPPWLLGATELPIRARVLGGVVLRGRSDVDAWLAWPGLAGLSRLGLDFLARGRASPAELADLSGQVLRDPRLGRLVELDLQLIGLDATPALQALADPGVMPGLRNVSVHGPTRAQLTAVRSRFGLRFRG